MAGIVGYVARFIASVGSVDSSKITLQRVFLDADPVSLDTEEERRVQRRAGQRWYGRQRVPNLGGDVIMASVAEQADEAASGDALPGTCGR